MGLYDQSDISKLLGLTITSITGATQYSDCVRFITKEGRTFEMYHEQDCCEDVVLEEVQGELDDLIGHPVTLAEAATENGPTNYESSTWTFYRLATERGVVVFRWLGNSNGYYSEEADFREVT